MSKLNYSCIPSGGESGGGGGDRGQENGGGGGERENCRILEAISLREFSLLKFLRVYCSCF